MTTEPDIAFVRADFHACCDWQPDRHYKRANGHIVAVSRRTTFQVGLKSSVWLALREAIAATEFACKAVASAIGRVERDKSGLNRIRRL